MTSRRIVTLVGYAPTTMATMTSCSIHHPQGYKLSKAVSPEADERIFMNVRHVAKTRDKLCILQKHVAVSVDMSKEIEQVQFL